MKTYFVLYSDGREETVKANSVKETLKIMSFYRGKTLVLAVALSEISRVGEKSFSPYQFEIPKIKVDDVIQYLASKGISVPALEMENNRASKN